MLDLLDSEAIYNKMDALRKEKGWSIYALAKKAGVTANALYHWRDRSSSPTLALLDGVCDALGITVISFLMDDDELISLTEEQKQVVNEWNRLSGEQKTSVLNLMKAIKRDFDN